MIQASKLMIGDYVEHNGFVCCVYSIIESPYPREDKRFDNKCVITLQNNGLFSCTEDEVNPIIIDDDFLIKNGFRIDEGREQNEYTLFDEGCNCIMDFCKYNDEGYYYTSLGWNGFVNFKYVHEFQHVMAMCCPRDYCCLTF